MKGRCDLLIKIEKRTSYILKLINKNSRVI